MFQINEVVEFDNDLYRILALLLEEVVWTPVTKAGIFPSLIPLETLVKSKTGCWLESQIPLPA